ncbi:MAG: hypothetical protein E7063_03530 [Spirochaetaceae bacterium]|nr:hypothetical protein [Spirochaetaceae bacterium]
MKKIFCTALVLLVTFFVVAEEITILSFNIKGTSTSNRQGNTEWLNDICNIISNSQADIVLLQEVCIELEKIPETKVFKRGKKDNLLDDMVKILGCENWCHLSTADYGLRANVSVNGIEYSSGDKTQNNAILYNSAKVQAFDYAEILGFSNFDGNFLFNKNTVQFIEFSLVNQEETKFFVVNVHLPYNNLEKRFHDLETLESLFAKYKHYNGVIIGGDFNLHRSELTGRNFDYVDGHDSWYYDKNFGLKTTVGKSEDGFSLVNDYDHFVYSSKINVKSKMRRCFSLSNQDFYKQVVIGEKTYTNSAEFNNKVSDHCPIIMVLEF